MTMMYIVSHDDFVDSVWSNEESANIRARYLRELLHTSTKIWHLKLDSKPLIELDSQAVKH
jgi:hypothetical protein